MKLTDVSSSAGAPMGRPNSGPVTMAGQAITFQLVRLLWVDGDYDAGGAYWGNSGTDDIYRATGEDAEGDGIELYVRADCFTTAWAAVLKLCPGALRAEVSGESDQWTADEHHELYPSLTYWASFNRFELRLPGQCVIDCSHSGDCGPDVPAWAGRIRELIERDGFKNRPTPELIRNRYRRHQQTTA